MILPAGLRRQLHRPLAAHERRVPPVLLAVLLAAAAAALVLTRPAGSATPGAGHHRSAPADTQVPAGSAGAHAPGVAGTVEGFLAGYLRYLYGRGPASSVQNATSAFTRSLETHEPRVPPGLRALHPRVLGLVAVPASAGEIAVTAIVTDGEIVRYRISLLLRSRGGAWRVSGLDTGS